MLKRKASGDLDGANASAKRSRTDSLTVSLSASSTVAKPRLARIITNFDGYQYPAVSVAAYDMSDSAPSPLEPPWDDWPFSDDEEDGETNSLFDEPVSMSAFPAFDLGASATSTTPDLSTSSIDADGHDDDACSLFDEPAPVRRTAPAIPGLHFDPELLLPTSLASSILAQLNAQYFPADSTRNQVMLFTRPTDSLPAPLDALLEHTSALLAPPVLSPETHDLLFKPRSDGSARQAIINRYAPGEGISPHVDLLGRYGDGIVGVSLGTGCAMAFAPASASASAGAPSSEEVYLPERSVLAMEGPARYEWSHGIPARTCDVVERQTTAEDAGTCDGDIVDSETIERGTRVSVTFRWLLPGAHVVGPA